MNVPTIEMDPADARTQLLEYAASLRRRWDNEYAAVHRGLQALADGDRVLSLPDAIQSGGFDAGMRPNLAIARADRRHVAFQWRPNTTSGRFNTRKASRPSDTLDLRVELGRRNGQMNQDRWGKTVAGYALVPMVPPGGLRVIGGASQLRYHFILWEVEEWADRPLQAIPDRDPYLMRHLGGDLYAVVFEWDLTDLERAAMAGRAREA